MAPAARNSMMLAGALLLSLAARGARAEFPAFPFSSIPACVAACVEKAGCDAIDLRCMCDKSGGAFLPEVAACIRAGCDASLSVDTLIEPLVNTCGTMDAPVPSAAVSSAHEAATGGAATTGGGGYPTQAPGEPSAVPKPPPRTTDTTLTTSTPAGTETPATSTPVSPPETTSATTTEGDATPTGTAAPTSPDASGPTSAPPESAAPADRASLLGASIGILFMLVAAW